MSNLLAHQESREFGRCDLVARLVPGPMASGNIADVHRAACCPDMGLQEELDKVVESLTGGSSVEEVLNAHIVHEDCIVVSPAVRLLD